MFLKIESLDFHFLKCYKLDNLKIFPPKITQTLSIKHNHYCFNCIAELIRKYKKFLGSYSRTTENQMEP